MELVHRILVPIDFSDCSRRALAYAVALAERIDADVELLHVWSPPITWAWAPLDGIALEAGCDAADAAQSLSQWVEEIARRSSVMVRGRIERGDVLHTLLEVAEQERYDLIVLGTHGRSAVSQLLLGSLTRKIVQRAPCPVLTVRPPPVPPARRLQTRVSP